MNTATVSMAVTPTVMSTFLSHYLKRKPLRERPTAHLSYDEGLHLIRSFLAFASHHTVEDLQAFTAQWVPHPQWVKAEEVKIPEDKLVEAARTLEQQLGPDGIRKVGGRNWWQWRKRDTPLKAEWIEMRADYNERKKIGDPGRRIMLYVHGGAYFFGSVGEHRYQLQRHARKLKARIFAPEYRLAPQYPFPCGLQDCLAAYLHLLETQDPNTIILAGDSAGGGMVVSMLVTMRDQGLPLPAGAVLISPWVDLTHSFPSVAADNPLDYIPPCGFHHKPSKAWPPLNAEEFFLLQEELAKNTKPAQTKLMKPESAERKRINQNLEQLASEKLDDGSPVNPLAETKYLTITLDGKEVQLKEQLQMYTTNELMSHPLVSPVMQPSLGGLPPLLIMTGGGEILRDEQIYLAHKCANPAKYPPGDAHMTPSAREQLARYKPTDVQLQVWDDLCHVAPTLSFTRPAKFMYRSVAQFGAWALARAQKRDIEILDDDDISVISSSGSDNQDNNTHAHAQEAAAAAANEQQQQQVDGTSATASAGADTKPVVGKAGDPLPPFKNHMIRQRVSRHGTITALDAAASLPGCQLAPDSVGVVKEGPVRKWLETRAQWDARYGSARARIHKARLREMAAGYVGFDGEAPPPSSLAARRVAGEGRPARKRTRSVGLALWSLWGSKHDEATVNREQEAGRAPEVSVASTAEEGGQGQGAGARGPGESNVREKKEKGRLAVTGRSRSRTKIVRDECQIADDGEEEGPGGGSTLVSMLMGEKAKQLQQAQSQAESYSEPLPLPLPLPSPAISAASETQTGVLGKRPILSGIAMPFSLNREADTASMLTLTSQMDHQSRVASPRPLSTEIGREYDFGAVVAPTSAAAVAVVETRGRDEVADPQAMKKDEVVQPESVKKDEGAGAEPVSPVVSTPGAEEEGETPAFVSPDATPLADGGAASAYFGAQAAAANAGRPPLETFVTAEEDLPMAGPSK
ncbi:alpha/beta-hydrolase [Whalleya microplaca]|nr:alpha/beta-hydrolase [Whalleya microplaca]